MIDAETLRATLERLQSFDDPATVHRAKQAASDDDDEVPALAEVCLSFFYCSSARTRAPILPELLAGLQLFLFFATMFCLG